MGKSHSVLVLVVLAALLAAGSWSQTAGTTHGAATDTSAVAAEKAPEVQLKQDTMFAYCALEMMGSYDQHAAAFDSLYAEAARQEIYGGMPFGIYWNSPSDTPVEKLKWDVGFINPSGKTPKEPLKLKKWSFTTVATLKYTGEFGAAMSNAYAQLFKWIAMNGYRPAGPIMETYLNIPSADEKGAFFGSIDIVVPVQKAPAAKGK
jgi:DNA gyrase inhibitor GyrI